MDSVVRYYLLHKVFYFHFSIQLQKSRQLIFRLHVHQVFLDLLPNYGQIAPFHLVLHLILKDQSKFEHLVKTGKG